MAADNNTKTNKNIGETNKSDKPVTKTNEHEANKDKKEAVKPVKK